MSRTSQNLDPTTFGTTSNGTQGSWPTITWNGTVWPIIAGGADEDTDSDGDATSGANEDSTTGDQGGTAEGSDEAKFTQEDVNKLIAKEVARAQRGKLDPKELGFDSSKDLKEFLENMKSKAEAEKDESEKALEAAVKQAQEEARASVLAQANTRVLKAEFLLAAKDHGIKQGAGNDAYVLAQTMEVWEDVEISDDGQVSGFDDTFFAELSKSKPFLFEEAGSDDIGAGARGGTPPEDDVRSKYPALQMPWYRKTS